MVASVYTFQCKKITDAVFVGFRGKEQISRPYEFELFFTVPVGVSLKEAVGQRAMLKADRADGRDPVAFHGVIARVSLLHQTTERALYRALLVPRLWMLRHFRRSHVFTFKTIQDFLTETLEDGGLQGSEFRFSIDPGQYPEEEFVAQYRESHLDFFQRWLEREGLYYYFEHKADAASEVLVIVDDKSQHSDFPGSGHVLYFPLFGEDGSAPEGLHQLEADMRWLPKTLTVADYDYLNPTAPLSAESPVTAGGCGIIHDYGYRTFVDKDIKRVSKVRAQAIGFAENTLRASGDALGPRPGYHFTVDDRPEDLDEKWLAIEVEHSGSASRMSPQVARATGLSADEVYSMKIYAVPAAVQYRSPQTTPWPRIYGFENGLVMGSAESPYAQLDAQGRYLVRFEFDTSDLADGDVSTRVRMLQPHGGETEGFHFPLRKNTEVMIGFLGGDPDRPFIAGVVPNARKPSVVGTRNHTQNIIRTGSNNQIVMEDQAGKEFIFIHTPNQRTGIYIGHPAGDQSKIYSGEGEQPTSQFFTSPASVAANDTNVGEDVPVSLWETTDGSRGLFVGCDDWVNIFGTENVFVYGAVKVGYLDTYNLDIGGNSTEYYHSQRTTTIQTGRTDTVVSGGKTQDLTPFLHQTVHGSGYQHVTASWEHTVDATNTDHYGTWVSNTDHTWTATIGEAISVTSTGGNITMQASAGSVDIKGLGGHVDLTGSASINLDAPSVTIRGADIKIDHHNWLEWYKMKGSIGILKVDDAVFVQTAAGLKIDTVGIKVENESCKKITGGMFLRAHAMSKKTALFGLADYAVGIWNGSFKKE